jgi:phage antirepressor YoqD-like protein
MISLRNVCKKILISETNARALYRFLRGRKYNYAADQVSMNIELAKWLGLPKSKTNTKSDHEWDAGLSCYAVLQGMLKRWRIDLHKLPTAVGETLVQPGGPSYYYWP